MYKVNTAFIVGAGASLELWFPTSAKLKEKIANAIDIRFETDYRQNAGDSDVAEALKTYADYNKPAELKEYNDHLQAGWHISQAMPQAISIDNFVDNQEDERVTRMAKLGIASCLIDAEKRCWELFRVGEFKDDVNWSAFQKTWIHHLCQTLTDGIRKSSVDRILENTKFIVFNYDRSLEFFLSKAISNYFGMAANEAEEIVAAGTFIHPYGLIGKLPWQKSDLPVSKFGSGEKNHLFEISQSILTFSEQIKDERELNLIRETVRGAEQLVFLGFAFHSSNMQLLQPDREQETNRVLATAYGISGPDCAVIEREVAKLCFRRKFLSGEEGTIILDNKSTCTALFNTYRKTILS